ncbi:MAG: ATP-binding protein [Elainella sp.]
MITNHALTDWVNHTLKGEIQQPLFESSGSEIILTRRGTQQPDVSTTPSRIQSTDICPYRGLEFFDELHADYFFGREALTAQLLDKLARDRFIAVVGASGSGKSSLVRAGLMAHLRQGRKIAGSEQWKVRLLTPTEHPLKSLASAFIDPELVDLERAEQLRRAETFLQDGGAGLAQLVRASLPSESTTGLGQRPQFLLIIDQFEEVFTLSQGTQAERERQEFFDCLIGALDLAKDWLKVVIVLRADFTGKCALYEGLAQQIVQHQVAVAPLKYEQIKATIVRPAQKVGLVCEPNLIYTMMTDVIGAPGELPLLQYTLLELWHRRRVGSEGGIARLTLDAYQALGGVRGTLQKRATEVYQSLSPEEQGVAKRIFLALTQLGEGTEDTRRRVAKSELIGPGFPAELVDQVLEKLVAAKLVVISQENLTKDAAPALPNCDAAAAETASALGSLHSLRTVTTQLTSASKLASSKFGASGFCSQEIVDVTHEALIRNWALLRGWVDQDREVVRRQRRIEQAASEWDQAGQPTTGDYLLSGLRLRDAEDFLKLYPHELSALGQQFVSVSCAACLRARRQSRRSQIAIPSALAATFLLVLSQSYSVIRSQSEKDSQAQKAKAYERTALAQAVLQDSGSDPTTALLLSRLAVQGGETGYATQASLRAALQNLRLQTQLEGHQGAVTCQ